LEEIMEFKFKQASKEKAKLRLAIFGPSGSGKTFTSLRLAVGLGGNIAVIDTERGSASKYADRFEFDVLELPKHDITTYVAAISAAQKAGYAVLVIDSLTHGWHELLDDVNQIARARYGGNTWAAWSEGTPKQRCLVDAILGFDGHIIATMRTKTEWIITKDNRGRNKPERVGMSPEQGKGIEYEFDLLMEITTDHIATVIKDRTGRFQDRIIEKPGEDLGQELAEWLADGEPPPHWIEDEDTRKKFWAYASDHGLDKDAVHTALGVQSVKAFVGTKAEAADKIKEYAEKHKPEQEAEPQPEPTQDLHWPAGHLAAFIGKSDMLPIEAQRILDLSDALSSDVGADVVARWRQWYDDAQGVGHDEAQSIQHADGMLKEKTAAQ
jgi:hypothetical protein